MSDLVPPGSSQVWTPAALPVGPLVSQSGPVIGEGRLGSPILGPVPVLVDQAIQCSSGEASAGSCSPAGYIHRCLHQRLGSPLQQSVSSRPLAAFRGVLSHQRAGVTSHSECSRKVVMFHSDNSSAVPSLQNQGGTHSLPMFRLAREILLLFQWHGITLLVRHIPGRLNALANSLSRKNQIIGTEWSLDPSIVRQMFSIWNIPEMGSVCNSTQSQAACICVSSSRPQGSSSGCTVHSMGQAMGLRLSTNRSDATSASQVCTLGTLLNASCGSTSALPAVASNPSPPFSGFSSREENQDNLNCECFTIIPSKFICSRGTYRTFLARPAVF